MPSHDAHGMSPMAGGWAVFAAAVLLVLFLAAAGYALALWSGRRRSPWPARRTATFYLGLACAGIALVGPVARAGHESFTMHMVGHLLLGMAAPLLLVLSAPVSAVLRGLPVRHARNLSRVLRRPFVRVVTHPVVAAVLNAGGLWLLYTTPLFHWMHESVLVHAVVHAHIFLAGYVFTASVVGVDPDPHRVSFRLRAAVLVVFIAAHSVLAKWLYAYPPAGVGVADARAGAQLMYYGGDVVDVTLIVLLFLGHYRATRPRPDATRRSSAAPSPISP